MSRFLVETKITWGDRHTAPGSTGQLVLTDLLEAQTPDYAKLVHRNRVTNVVGTAIKHGGFSGGHYPKEWTTEQTVTEL
jgi:hypothetical protein